MNARDESGRGWTSVWDSRLDRCGECGHLLNTRVRQERVIRWTVTAVLVGCAVTFCITLGDLSFSGSVGWLFGALFALVPTVSLWGRALYEGGVQQERAELQQQGTSMGRLLRDEDDEPQVRDVHYAASPWPDDDD